MAPSDLRQRTKAFSLRIIKLVAAVPRSREGDAIARQVMKSGTSIGANWREATRASSKRQFISTCEICIREADETMYWLEILTESGLLPEQRLAGLRDECDQLLAILTATAKQARRNLATPGDSTRTQH